MISFGNSDYIPQLKSLWTEVFGDGESYLNAFFDQIYNDKNTLVYLENEEVISALYMIPYQFKQSDRLYQMNYLYALATKAEYRGRGIMTKLIRKAIDISAERKISLVVLIPAEPALFKYYEKFGFVSNFDKIEVTKTIDDIRTEVNSLLQAQELDDNNIELKSADRNDIWQAYANSVFSIKEGVLLSKNQNDFYITEFINEGGETFLFDMYGKQDGYAMIKKEQDHLFIYETNIDEKKLFLFYQALLKKYQFQSVTFYQPLCFFEHDKGFIKSDFAMVHKINNIELNEPFINRVLM